MGRTEVSKFGLAKFGLAVSIAAGAAILAAPCGFAQTQDAQPSVADAARAAAAAKKDKAAPKTVITDDTFGSNSAVASKGGGSTGAAVAAAASAVDAPDKFKNLDEAWGKLQATEVALARLEPLDKSQMANLALQGNTSDFPGRAQWEDKLYAAKTSYVERSEQLVLAARQLLTEIAELQKEGPIAPNDPRFQALAKRSKQLTQLTARTEADFQSVLSEGKSSLK
jgi:hypothetical protein